MLSSLSASLMRFLQATCFLFPLFFAVNARATAADLIPLVEAEQSLSGLVQSVVGGYLKSCELALADPTTNQAREELALLLLKSKIQQLAHPTDRAIVALSVNTEQKSFQWLSQDVWKKIEVLLLSNLSMDQLIYGSGSGVTNFGNDTTAIAALKRSNTNIGRMIKARDEKKFSEAITIYDETMTTVEKDMILAQQALAFCLNRRKTGDDRARAEKILLNLIEVRNLRDGETYGLLGRIYKDLAAEDTTVSKPQDSRYFDQAIKAYRQGFINELTNYYPGVNAVVLLLEKGDEASLKQAQGLYSALGLAIEGAIERGDRSYWAYSSWLQHSLLAGDWENVEKADVEIQKLKDFTPAMLESSLATHEKIARIWKRLVSAGSPLIPADNLRRLEQRIETVRERIQLLRAGFVTKVTESLVSHSRIIEVDTEGFILNQAIDRDAEIQRAGIGNFQQMIEARSQGVLTIHEMLAVDPDVFNEQQLLGLTQRHHRLTYEALRKRFGMKGWQDAYQKLGLNGDEAGHVDRFMDATTQEQGLVFLVPPNLLFSQDKPTHTAQEFLWLTDHPERMSKTTFVLGSDRIFSESFVQAVADRFQEEHGIQYLSRITELFRFQLDRSPNRIVLPAKYRKR